jgi:hypothetical protein
MTSTLLGYLARFASFSAQSEVLCTQGLAYLLQEHEEARTALAGEVEAQTGIRINDSLTWIPEALQRDGGRVDLEARTADEVPVVKIEAKLGAKILAAQLQSYEADLHRRNDGEAALLVLVPKRRIVEAAKVTAEALGLKGLGPWRVSDGHRSGTAVISWDELFDVLRSGKDERFRHELEQLQSMYYELSSDFIAPLASDEDLRQWRTSETDFVKLVDQVTRHLTTQHSIYPMQLEPLEDASQEDELRYYHRRYVCPCVDDAASCYSIGVRDSFAQWVTPIWMRFHKDTGNFQLTRQRIELSDLEKLPSGGHIWIPLHVPRDASGDQMVKALIEQAEEVIRVAYQAE